MQRVTIIGAGFAGLTAAEQLRKRDKEIEITLIAPKAEFVYGPSLIWVPTGLRSGDDCVVPLAHFFAKHRIRHFAGRCEGLKDGGRTVVTDRGEVANDGLVIASGGRFIKKLPGIEHALTICEGVEPAKAARDRLAAMDGGSIAFGFAGNPNDPTAVRGGPMFELLFGIDSFLRKHERRDRFQLKFFSPAPKPGIRLGETAYAGIIREMQRRGVEIASLGSKLTRFEADKVVTEAGEIPADLILFMPGLTGPAWLENTDLPRSPGGMIEADEYCRVKGFERAFVAGDSGSFPGPDWAPKQAHMADLQAHAAAVNLLDGLKGREPRKTFRWELICIVDAYDSGILVFRNERLGFMSPPSRLMHWSKRLFERHYLRDFRG
jgi:sulfide:quinone oxidoreductase